MVKKISIVIPARDEHETIGMVLSEISSVTKSMSNYLWEIIVVTDHCVDKTAQIAKKCGASILDNPYDVGKGNALRAGFLEARGDIIIMMDADYSHKAEDIKQLIKPLSQQDVGLVIGSRSLGGSGEYTVIRTLGNIFLTFFVNLLFHLRLTDSLNGYKAFKRSILKYNPLSGSSFEIEIELIYNTLLGDKRIIEIPSYERVRAGGTMKSHAIIDGFRFFICILKNGIRYNSKRLFSFRLF